ncbi:MAG: nitrous oxide reductase accessory protein NosL [Candidatus Scalindua sp.]|nr:nitrous oxide reductase accessory protein NosL [Candidatus Scalindua sp.]
MKYGKKELFFSSVFALMLVTGAFYSSSESVYAQTFGHHESGQRMCSHLDLEAENVKCPLCGMRIKGNQNTDYQIIFDDEKIVSYVCPHCGLWEHAKHKDKIISARAVDFISGEWKDVTTMFMLHDSSAVPGCSDSWISFGSRSDAEKFQKGFGGTIYTFTEALKVRGEQPLGH